MHVVQLRQLVVVVLLSVLVLSVVLPEIDSQLGGGAVLLDKLVVLVLGLLVRLGVRLDLVVEGEPLLLRALAAVALPPLLGLVGPVLGLGQVQVLGSVVPLELAAGLVALPLVAAVSLHLGGVDGLRIHEGGAHGYFEAVVGRLGGGLLAAVGVLLQQVVGLVLLLQVQVEVLVGEGLLVALVVREQRRLLARVRAVRVVSEPGLGPVGGAVLLVAALQVGSLALINSLGVLLAHSQRHGISRWRVILFLWGGDICFGRGGCCEEVGVLFRKRTGCWLAPILDSGAHSSAVVLILKSILVQRRVSPCAIMVVFVVLLFSGLLIGLGIEALMDLGQRTVVVHGSACLERLLFPEWRARIGSQVLHLASAE